MCSLQDADGNLIQESIEETTLGLCVVKSATFNEPEDIGIVLEGQVVL